MNHTVTHALDERIVDFIHDRSSDRAAFDRLALEVFAYQYDRNDAYRRLCDRVGRTPATVGRWEDVPSVPTASFGDARLATFPPGDAVLRFVSSGTTTAGARPSIHELDTTALYDASLQAHFDEMVVPDRLPLRIIALVPTFEAAQHSSLSYMVAMLIRRRGAGGSGWFVDDDGIRFDALCDALARSDDAPALVFGTAFSFVHLFDRLRAARKRFVLPPASRVVETGGFKGRSRVVERDELYAAFGEMLGVERDRCVSEYGMCELGSQWYDATIADSVAGRRIRPDVKVGPHWARTSIVDPVTADPVPPGAQGLLRVFDLSNRGSVASIITGDLAHAVDGGFVLLGRHPGAPPKGCSIDADVLLAKDRG